MLIFTRGILVDSWDFVSICLPPTRDTSYRTVSYQILRQIYWVQIYVPFMECTSLSMAMHRQMYWYSYLFSIYSTIFFSTLFNALWTSASKSNRIFCMKIFRKFDSLKAQRICLRCKPSSKKLKSKKINGLTFLLTRRKRTQVCPLL